MSEPSRVPEAVDSLYRDSQVSEELRKIIPIFLETLRKSCVTMRDALAVQDYKSVGKQAHNIIGSGGSCGFPDITAIGRNIERAIVAGDDAGIRSELDRLSTSLDKIQSCNHT